MLCVSNQCGCAFESSTLNISTGPEGQVILEQAEFTDITALEVDVALLQSQMADALSDISALQTSDTTNTASVIRLDSMRAGTVPQSGAGVGPVGGTAVVIASASPGPFGQAGTLLWGGHAVYTKTVAGDTFDIHARDGGFNRARGADRAQITSGWTSAATGLALSATDDPTIDVALIRNAGTGTATTGASARDGGLWWLFLPN